MKKNVFITMLIVLFLSPTLSAQSFLKKIGDAAKKITTTEQKNGSNQKMSSQNEYQGPVNFRLESTRIIGDKLLISGKVEASEDLRLMLTKITAISPDGDTYESKNMWWGGKQITPMSFDNKLTSGINYNADIAIEIKGKVVNSLASLTIEAFNHTTQKKFKISLNGITVPSPINPNLTNADVVEIDKNIYLRWTKAEETATSLKINFIVENKGNKDVEMQFLSYNNAKITDNEGNSYEAVITLKDNVNFPVGTPVAGNFSMNKPIKINQISLLEFSSRYFNYKIRKIVIPTN